MLFFRLHSTAKCKYPANESRYEQKRTRSCSDNLSRKRISKSKSKSIQHTNAVPSTSKQSEPTTKCQSPKSNSNSSTNPSKQPPANKSLKTAHKNSPTLPSCFQLNINGLDTIYKSQKTKSKILNDFVNTSDEFIPYFIITETHLKSYHFDAEVDCPNYTITRSDRPITTKGGVAIFVHDKLSIDCTYKFADKICQAAGIFNSLLNLLIIAVYRPPSRNLPEEETSFTLCLNEIQEMINNHKDADIQIHGDFNLGFINWNTGEINRTGRLKCEQKDAKTLISFMNKNLLVQLVSENTRHDKSLLDIVLTNNEQAIHSITTEKTTLSDHDFVHCSLLYNKLSLPNNYNLELEKTGLDNVNMNKADYDSIRKELSNVNWTEILDQKQNNVKKMHDILNNKIIKICCNHAPQYPPGRKVKKFIPKNRRSLLKTRHVKKAINICKYLKPKKK